MKTILLQQNKVNLVFTSSYPSTTTGKQIFTRSANIKLSPVINDERIPVQKALRNLQKRHGTGTQGNSTFWNIKLEVGMALQNNNSYGSLSATIKLYDAQASGILETLKNQCGSDIKLKVAFSNIGRLHGSVYESFNISTNEESLTRNTNLGRYGIERENILVENNYDFFHIWNSGCYTFQGDIKIIAILPDDCFQIEDISIEDKLFINKMLLNEEISCDANIIPKTGVAVKCHKSFLSAHSSVFRTMFQGSMKEAKTNIVEISDMSEASVRAFLAYIYYWDTKEPNKNSLICFELFHAGHKYDIGKLEECMRKILLGKDNLWYDVDVAMRLFLFSRNIGTGAELKTKAIQVLKSKFSVLEKSKSYQELFKRDPKAAMELCKYAISA